ncbi:adenine-specific DNA-methyltransferase [Sphingomonas sp. PP-CE-3G-477]|jgi:adenine-specific DNA-methyltransferase|uniref:site-specific DNA-methyltransferase n=1 Tax=Sphingomonas sp. PP-CE-3G-477 TaxID=2135660 RepID=UPI000D375D4F|nr:site-specific DNA-methyltransferase [Sphingomonas sp. PP-CE-3G-477]PTQ59145.1 adenine-specific DNA-methyltransferase [Sphingomonas sp. PP-CE-3G-477]
MKKQKLELTWVGKENRPRLEPRILVEEPALSHHSTVRRVGDLFDNRLIQGDNLLALKALEAEFAGQVKCVFIDPPYNTGSAFEHYDDGLEHSLWLSMMRDRLELIRRLLRPDGSLWVTIDDREMPYLRILLDEVFGRASFIAQNVWQKRYSRDNNSAIGDVHDYVICYAINAATFKTVRNKIEIDEKTRSAYRNPTNDPKGPWRLIPMNGAGIRKNQQYPVQTPSGKTIFPPEGRHWSILEEKFLALVAEGKVFFGKNGESQPGLIRYLSEVEGLVPWTWWPHEEVGHTDESKKEIQQLFGKSAAFDTPKPERLIKRVLEIATNPGDLVLDSFAGSGTTGAVAHKMGRRWIMVELGDHARTLVAPRLRGVIDNEDRGGVTEATGWRGGGGYRYFRLAPSLLEYDKWGREVVSKAYNPAMLAEALCKLEGFTYAPSETEYWNHGHSTEHDYLYVTTQTLTHEQLRDLSEQVGEGRTLLVMCAAYRGDARSLPNLTVKKIPDHVRDRCEWGRDDYSLEISALPMATEPKPNDVDLFGAPAK